jgi:hypothetical protein
MASLSGAILPDVSTGLSRESKAAARAARFGGTLDIGIGVLRAHRQRTSELRQCCQPSARASRPRKALDPALQGQPAPAHDASTSDRDPAHEGGHRVFLPGRRRGKPAGHVMVRNPASPSALYDAPNPSAFGVHPARLRRPLPVDTSRTNAIDQQSAVPPVFHRLPARVPTTSERTKIATSMVEPSRPPGGLRGSRRRIGRECFFTMG